MSQQTNPSFMAMATYRVQTYSPWWTTLLIFMSSVGIWPESTLLPNTWTHITSVLKETFVNEVLVLDLTHVGKNNTALVGIVIASKSKILPEL
jgi:hypothetical protein